MGMKSRAGGETVQVQGGHILRSTGRKDWHSKVCTAKGPRDRRVRLSAHTAIQFYDVQDRLGYDRPSKAVDWLIKKAKNAIDKLAGLPPWNPNDTTIIAPNEGSSGMALEQQSEPSSGYAFQLSGQLGENPIDAHSIADTMKSFFPTSSGINFQNYPDDIMSRASIETEDLCLSLHSLQDPNSIHTPPTDHHGLFSGPSPVTLEVNYPRMIGWDGGGDGENKAGFFFNSQQSMPQPQMLCQSSAAFSHRKPLQSSFSPLVSAWDDLPFPSSDHHNTQPVHHFSISSSQFASEQFSWFQVPPRIHGAEPSYASTNSHH